MIAGQEFETTDDIAKELLAAGVVRKPDRPRILYDTKVIIPEASEVGARLPFCNRHMPHEEPAPVASESDPVLPVSDVPIERTSHPGGRRGRKGFASPG